MSKTSDWNQRAIDRRDFRHGKVDLNKPERTTHKSSKNKKKKTVVLQYKPQASMFGWGGNWSSYGKYRTREIAVEVFRKQHLKYRFYAEAEWRIRGEKKNLTMENTE
jgi:hypothetical protein